MDESVSSKCWKHCQINSTLKKKLKSLEAPRFRHNKDVDVLSEGCHVQTSKTWSQRGVRANGEVMVLLSCGFLDPFLLLARVHSTSSSLSSLFMMPRSPQSRVTATTSPVTAVGWLLSAPPTCPRIQTGLELQYRPMTRLEHDIISGPWIYNYTLSIHISICLYWIIERKSIKLASTKSGLFAWEMFKIWFNKRCQLLN